MLGTGNDAVIAEYKNKYASDAAQLKLNDLSSAMLAQIGKSPSEMDHTLIDAPLQPGVPVVAIVFDMDAKYFKDLSHDVGCPAPSTRPVPL